MTGYRTEHKFDYRVDASSHFEVSLGDAKLVLGYEWRYDSVPPNLRGFAEALPAGQIVEDLMPVSSVHRITSLKLKWELQP